MKSFLAGGLLLLISMHCSSADSFQLKTSVCKNGDYDFMESKDIGDDYDTNLRIWSEFNTLYKDKKSRKLVVFLDGTRNNADKPTNIRFLYRMALTQACRGEAIIPYYDKGVGTHMNDQFSGSAFGSGVSRNIRQAYQFLSHTYKAKGENSDGDDIYIFGFSRGAFTARSLNGFIEMAGLLDGTKMSVSPASWWPFPAYIYQGFTQINYITEKVFNEYHIVPYHKYGFDDYLKSTIKSFVEKNFPKESFQRVNVKVIGVFDTVPAIGFFLNDEPDNHRLDLYAQKGFHALSLDEQREAFELNRFNKNRLQGNELIEIWFAGGHSDIGGGYPKSAWCNKDSSTNEYLSGLSTIPLKWMLASLKEEKLFPSSAESQLEECSDGELHDEYYETLGIYKIIKGKKARKPRDKDCLHISILERIKNSKITPLPKPHNKREPFGLYNPENLENSIESYKFIKTDFSKDCLIQ
ncbi:MAG: hypothetical protein A4S08_11515 [Proteobacteria bacterium SG_bin4]|nr:MAG: hypothetical protein A4S08_11515 [Proteobacteria bacterium SG_bin4]